MKHSQSAPISVAPSWNSRPSKTSALSRPFAIPSVSSPHPRPIWLKDSKQHTDADGLSPSRRTLSVFAAPAQPRRLPLRWRHQLSRDISLKLQQKLQLQHLANQDQAGSTSSPSLLPRLQRLPPQQDHPASPWLITCTLSRR